MRKKLYLCTILLCARMLYCKRVNIICTFAVAFFVLTTVLISCSGELDYSDPVNKSDVITFSVGGITTPSTTDASSRADDHTHSAWDPVKHANTLGVFGYGDGDTIFNNQKVVYNTDSIKWEYSPAKYWPEYSDKTSFDFFGYMVENADLPSALLKPSGNTYTLSFPASIANPILTSPDNTPLICCVPSRSSFGSISIPPFVMDQTLTGYSLWFQLGKKMDNVRDFIIKSVKVYGNNLPVSGTISRTYTLADGNWTAGDVTWTGVTTSNVPTTSAVSIPTSAESIKVNTHTDWVKWGDPEKVTDGAFFAIPSDDFTPTIEVTYDVVANDDNNGDESTITRKDVTSTIILNKDNFSELTKGTTGKIHPIKIKIVPKYLYVLSDDDHTTGVLVTGK